MFFAAGEPVSVDRPYWVELRGAGELVALGAAGRPSQYTIVSSVPDVDAAALRAAGHGLSAADRRTVSATAPRPAAGAERVRGGDHRGGAAHAV